MHPPEASEALGWVLDAIDGRGSRAVGAHLRRRGAAGAAARVRVPAGCRSTSAVLSAADHDALAEALEAGETVALGVVPGTDPAAEPTDTQLTERVLRWLDMLGLDPAEVGERLVVTPACGLAGASPTWARTALGLLTRTAANLR